MDDLKYLKKHYGENFAHLCRESFSTILENEGLLSKLISDHFAPTHSLYQDIIRSGVQDDFKSFIYSLVTVENRDVPVEREKLSPKKLLDKAGYILYDECMTEEDIQSFKKYYAKGEELCTFKGHRLDYCRVWFAVKKNVDDIKREHFTRPTRQDEYVISVQFSKGEKSTLSIKNRYNHRVDHPDATFGNNLDNIIPGLTNAFVDTYHINLVNNNYDDFEIEPYVLAGNGKYYRSNFESDNIHYCEDNVVIDNAKVITFDKDRYILAENYIIDQKEKTVTPYKKESDTPDSFVESIGKVKDIVITTDSGHKVVKFITKKGGRVELALGTHNEIIGYLNEDVTAIGNDFLFYNRVCEWVDLPNVTKVGNRFLYCNKELIRISLPKVTGIGYSFLCSNKSIENISLPKVEMIGDCFLECGYSLKNVNISNAKYIGSYCLYNVMCLGKIDVHSAKVIGDYFLRSNTAIKSIDLRSATTIGNNCLENNCVIERVNAPNARQIGKSFLENAKRLQWIDIRSVKQIGYYSLISCNDLKEAIIPRNDSIERVFGCVRKYIKANNGTIRYADEVEEEEEVYECEP